MTLLPGLAQARMGYTPPPPLLVVPAEDGTAYAEQCHRRAMRDDRAFEVLCRQHGLLPRHEHKYVHYAARLDTRDDVRRLAGVVRRQVGFFTSPLFVESWCWPAEEDALTASRRVVVVRSPLTGMNVLNRMQWLDSAEEA